MNNDQLKDALIDAYEENSRLRFRLEAQTVNASDMYEPEPPTRVDRMGQWFVEAGGRDKICGPIIESRQGKFDWEHWGADWLLPEKWIQNGNWRRIPPPPTGQDVTVPGWECREPRHQEPWYTTDTLVESGSGCDGPAPHPKYGLNRWIPPSIRTERHVANEPTIPSGLNYIQIDAYLMGWDAAALGPDAPDDEPSDHLLSHIWRRGYEDNAASMPKGAKHDQTK